ADVVKQLSQRCQLGSARAGAEQIIEKTRRVFEVFRFAVAMAQARKNADHFQMTMRTHEIAIGVERRKLRRHGESTAARALPVLLQPADAASLRPADERILEQADRVVANRAAHGVLKIEDAR